MNFSFWCRRKRRLIPPSFLPASSIGSFQYSTFQWAGGLAWLIQTWWQMGLAIGLPAVYYMNCSQIKASQFHSLANEYGMGIRSIFKMEIFWMYEEIQAEINDGFVVTISCLRNSQLNAVNRWQICLLSCQWLQVQAETQVVFSLA